MNHYKPQNSLLRLLVVTLFLSTASTLFCPLGDGLDETGTGTTKDSAAQPGRLERFKNFFRHDGTASAAKPASQPETTSRFSDAVVKGFRTLKNIKAAVERYKLQKTLTETFNTKSNNGENEINPNDAAYKKSLQSSIRQAQKKTPKNYFVGLSKGKINEASTSYTSAHKPFVVDFREIDPTKPLVEQAGRLSNVDASDVQDQADAILKNYADWLTTLPLGQDPSVQTLRALFKAKTGKNFADFNIALKTKIEEITTSLDKKSNLQKSLAALLDADRTSRAA